MCLHLFDGRQHGWGANVEASKALEKKFKRGDVKFRYAKNNHWFLIGYKLMKRVARVDANGAEYTAVMSPFFAGKQESWGFEPHGTTQFRSDRSGLNTTPEERSSGTVNRGFHVFARRLDALNYAKGRFVQDDMALMTCHVPLNAVVAYGYFGQKPPVLNLVCTCLEVRSIWDPKSGRMHPEVVSIKKGTEDSNRVHV